MKVNWLSLLGIDAWLARWRANAIEGVIAAEDRLELARLEWQEHKRHMARILLLGIALAGLTVVALVMLSVAVMVHFWDMPQRALVAWCLAIVWLLIWGGLAMCLVAHLRKAGNAFALTRNELSQDWRALKERL